MRFSNGQTLCPANGARVLLSIWFSSRTKTGHQD
jgi:hypothetical protein